MTLGRRTRLKRSGLSRTRFKARAFVAARARDERELDLLAKRLIVAMDGPACRRCGSRAAEVHHLVTRRRKTLRWDADNLVLLCIECHRWWHDVASRQERWEWACSALPADRIARLELKRMAKSVMVSDLAMVEADLERRLLNLPSAYRE